MFFDAGNTLLRLDYERLTEALGSRGVSADATRVRDAELRARVRLDAWLVGGGSTESEQTGSRYTELLLAELGVSDSPTAHALTEWRRQVNPPLGLWTRPDPEAFTALALLRESGVRAAVISNSNGTVRSILGILGLAPHLEFVLDSAEVGIEKPDPRIFALALERARLDPEDAVYIGDLFSIDVLGARAAGLEAILLDPGGYWGDRDCPVAGGIHEGCRLALERGR